MKDCLGREIKVGDRVAYGVRVGNHGGLVTGTVEGFGERNDSWTGKRLPTVKVRTDARGEWQPSRLTTVAMLDRMVVLKP